ncbi:MAG: glutathione S-transferase family protein [Hyphomonadaceae bacterium]|nr:glutathione S-transferase family protein [Hyphomonadaceae bacterium]
MPKKADALTIYHIPGCPFSERVEILLALKGIHLNDVEIDISKPRPDWLLEKTRGSTALPAMDVPEGTLKESMIILRYLEDRFPERPVAQKDPYKHAVESLLAQMSGDFSGAGYRMILNRDVSKREELRAGVDAQFAALDAFLKDYAPKGDFLFKEFGWAEAAMTPMFKRLWFIDYYEDYKIPAKLKRVARWREACTAHPAAQGRSWEEIITLYYDYAQGAGNGRIPEGRKVSSFTLDPHWSKRPLPPKDKWGKAASDVELGLVKAAKKAKAVKKRA